MVCGRCRDFGCQTCSSRVSELISMYSRDERVPTPGAKNLVRLGRRKGQLFYENVTELGQTCLRCRRNDFICAQLHKALAVVLPLGGDGVRAEQGRGQGNGLLETEAAD